VNFIENFSYYWKKEEVPGSAFKPNPGHIINPNDIISRTTNHGSSNKNSSQVSAQILSGNSEFLPLTA
jgi:hypothetical protein